MQVHSSTIQIPVQENCSTWKRPPATTHHTCSRQVYAWPWGTHRIQQRSSILTVELSQSAPCWGKLQWAAPPLMWATMPSWSMSFIRTCRFKDFAGQVLSSPGRHKTKNIYSLGVLLETSVFCFDQAIRQDRKLQRQNSQSRKLSGTEATDLWWPPWPSDLHVKTRVPLLSMVKACLVATSVLSQWARFWFPVRQLLYLAS